MELHRRAHCPIYQNLVGPDGKRSMRAPLNILAESNGGVAADPFPRLGLKPIAARAFPAGDPPTTPASISAT